MQFKTAFAEIGPLTRIAAMALGAALTAAAAPAAAATKLFTHQSYVEELQQPADVDVRDPKAVLEMVLGSLPAEVKVYPTENYYYFKFHQRGLPYAGNIRLENGLRDQGKVHFAYAVEATGWGPAAHAEHVLFDSAQGVAVEKIDRFHYRITFRGKSVVFALNDLSGVKPPDGLLGPHERYIGPVFDDSAIRFFLIYNDKIKTFMYLLDETVPEPDELRPTRVSDRILIGLRTGFAYYRDEKRERKILIGAYEPNATSNSYFDGPFDQLPDNFIDGEALRSAILDIDPSLKGKIDRFGSMPDDDHRYLIAPYLYYNHETDLALFRRCATDKRVSPDLYYGCFDVLDGPKGHKPVLAAQLLQEDRNRATRAHKSKRH
jgi:hypothetical protein